MAASLAAVDDVPVHDVSPMKVHRLLSGSPGSQVVSSNTATCISL
jgi:hypothetical protein